MEISQELQAHLDTSAAELLLDMFPNLNSEQGVPAFQHCFESQCFHCSSAAHFRSGHLDLQEARAALRSCLASDNNEGLMAELKSSHVLAEAHLFLHGECLLELPHMTKHASELPVLPRKLGDNIRDDPKATAFVKTRRGYRSLMGITFW